MCKYIFHVTFPCIYMIVCSVRAIKYIYIYLTICTVHIVIHPTVIVMCLYKNNIYIYIYTPTHASFTYTK